MARPTDVQLLPPEDPYEILPTASTQGRRVREDFRQAFQKLGGSEWLVDFVQRDDQNARTFLSCLSKIIPAEMGEVSKDEKVQVVVNKVVHDGLMQSAPQPVNTVVPFNADRTTK